MAGIRSCINIFKCPVCGQKMASEGLRRIYCLKEHSFDLSKDGYVNLLAHQVKTGYDKKMFSARRRICAGGFYNPLLRIVKRYIINNLAPNYAGDMSILDVGCGEGSHLARLIADLDEEDGITARGIGIDIAKEGIRMAAKNHAGIVWCVSNLAEMPFINESFPVLLNIMSPANYSEFKRIISKDGLLIKVLPGNRYLTEIRESLYRGAGLQSYSNMETAWLFKDNFNLLEMRQVNYKVKINAENLEHVLDMTPLAWGASRQAVESLKTSGITEITADFTIMAGKKRW